MDKVDFKKKPPRKKKICIFFQSSHQVDMKNMVDCPREFFAYFNALETYREMVQNWIVDRSTARDFTVS